MNSYSLSLNLKFKPETLERVLRVIRHRGFKVTSLNMRQDAPSDANIQLTVVGEREIILLTNQLNKLIDVIDSKLISEEARVSGQY